MPKIARARNFRKPFNANPRKTEHGAFGMMDGVFRHDGNSSHRRAHSNEFAPIYINRRVYGPDHARSLRVKVNLTRLIARNKRFLGCAECALSNYSFGRRLN